MSNFFERELYIRLNDGEGAFVCTTRYGKFYRKAKKFLLQEPEPGAMDRNATALVRKKRRVAPLSLLKPDD